MHHFVNKIRWELPKMTDYIIQTSPMLGAVHDVHKPGWTLGLVCSLPPPFEQFVKSKDKKAGHSN